MTTTVASSRVLAKWKTLPCSFFQEGNCKRGNNCNFLHTGDVIDRANATVYNPHIKAKAVTPSSKPAVRPPVPSQEAMRTVHAPNSLYTCDYATTRESCPIERVGSCKHFHLNEIALTSVSQGKPAETIPPHYTERIHAEKVAAAHFKKVPLLAHRQFAAAIPTAPYSVNPPQQSVTAHPLQPPHPTNGPYLSAAMPTASYSVNPPQQGVTAHPLQQQHPGNNLHLSATTAAPTAPYPTKHPLKKTLVPHPKNKLQPQSSTSPSAAIAKPPAQQDMGSNVEPPSYPKKDLTSVLKNASTNASLLKRHTDSKKSEKSK